ncbi:transposase [Methylobacterium sp. J-001]|uniref:transposase n=1 Tax=Methylobacterium sp. J-001 TaxID=2836609 RepID=UPI00391C9209
MQSIRCKAIASVVQRGMTRPAPLPWARQIAIVAESVGPSTSISAVARRHGLNASRLFTWQRLVRQAGGTTASAHCSSCRP